MKTGVLLVAAHVVSMLGFATYAALLPELRGLWRLSNSEAGIIGGAYFAGYIATVSYWTALTDRLDPRRIYAAGSLLAAAGGAGFGLAADGLPSALLLQALLGAGTAATYMPGLRLLSDRVSGPEQSRYIAFYTACFGIGIALSLAMAGAVAPLAGWRAAFLASAAGPVAAGLMVVFGLRATERKSIAGPASVHDLFPLRSWRIVLANRAAAGYTLGYAVHCLELFGSRAWMVAFLAFSAGLHAPGPSFPWSAASIAAIANLVSVSASIGGNEFALRIGRRAWILIAMAASGSAGIVVGLSAPWHWAIVLALMVAYSMLVMAESATLTAGLVAAAPAELRGAAMGLYSLAGFGGGMLGPVVFGAALDAAGGGERPAAWAIAYGAIGAGCLAAPVLVRVFGRPRRIP